ncbi:MAG: hypothetical protein VX951_12560 [Planctomycetota bacterium]|nr:hypothetical protein [Planctomycetota bacterium]
MLASILGLAAVVSAQGGKSTSYLPIEAPLARSIESLRKQSSWEQNTSYEGKRPDKTQRGVYPVGNGRVFTYIGLGERANTMMALTGPTYADPSKRLPRGNFGELTMDLGDQDLSTQRVRRVTDANFVITEDRSKAGLALRTLTFAEPSGTTITRVVHVENGTNATIKDLKLFARLSGSAEARNNKLVVNHRNYQAVFALSAADVQGNALVTALGELPAGATSEAVLTISTGSGKVEATDPSTNLATKAAKSTIEWWQKKLRGTPKLNTNHRKVMDLFHDWKVLMLTMRDAHSGIVSPMVTRRGAMIRESTGPILTFLRYNMWEEARGILEYFHNAILLTGEIREYFPMDLDFAGITNANDYSAIKVPDSDLASWVVLQHFWYFRATLDAKYIKTRQPFLLHLLQKQKRGKDTLMQFSGHENFMRSVFDLDINAMSSNPLFIAETPSQDRRSYSLTSAVVFLMAIQAYGDMLNGIDKLENPTKWATEVDPSERPGTKWMERSFSVMQDIESKFYVQNAQFRIRDDLEKTLKFGEDWTGFFAPAISPVNGEPHREPFANINLLPIWVGFTFPTGERSRHNLRNTLARLHHAKATDGKRVNTLVGTTATVGHFTGDVPGMLLTALVERNGVDRTQALEDLMDISEPACEWGVLYNPEGRPIASSGDTDWPDRLSPNECGINLDATIFALNGVRHVNIPNFDNKSIKVKLRLPSGATFMNMDNLKKDGRAFNVHVDEFYAPLSPLEIKRNDAQRDKRYKRDPKVDHRRFRFRMRLLSDNPPGGRYQVDADVVGTMFVRYLYRGQANGESGDIDDREFWGQDKERFFLDDSPITLPTSQVLKATEGADLLVLTNRSQCSAVLGKDKITYVDTGLPFSGRDLVRLMLKDGKATHPTLLLDVGYNASDRRTFKQEKFWQHRNWQKALSDFEASGGKIVTNRFVESYEVERKGTIVQTAAPAGRLALDGKSAATARFKLRSERARDDVVLRLGSGCGYSVRCNNEVVAEESGARMAIRDQDSMLLTLKKGENTIEVQLHPDGPQTLFARVTDTRGLPPSGVR